MLRAMRIPEELRTRLGVALTMLMGILLIGVAVLAAFGPIALWLSN
jgi:hypothetical protein